METENQEFIRLLEVQRENLARTIVDEQWQRDPTLDARYGADGHAKCVQDVNYNLSYLSQAIAADSKALFADYIDWVKVLFEGLNIPAEDLQVSLEITSDLLQQRFPERMGETAADYISAALHRLTGPAAQPPSFITTAGPLASLAQDYLAALLRGERHTAGRLVLDAVASGVSVKDVYLHVFQVSQREVGRLWQMNKVSVAQEHYCTAATQLIMSQLYPHIFSTHKTGRRMVAACVGNELHELGLRMVADFFEIEGWDTFYLGANVPARDIVRTIIDQEADLLAISATMTFHIKLVETLIGQVRAAATQKPIKVLVGGYPFNIEPALWERVGADGYASDAQKATQMVDSLLD